MKLIAVTAAVALASGSAVSADPCIVTDIGTTLNALLAPAAACQTATGYTFIIATKRPTEEQLTSICAKCPDLLATTKSVVFPTCTLPIDGEQTEISALYLDLVRYCAANATTSTKTPAATKTPASPTDAGATTGKNGHGASVVVGIIAGAIVVVLLVLVIIVQHKRRTRPDKLDPPTENDGYVNMSDAVTDDTLSGADLFLGDLKLAAFRIPTKHLQLGEAVSQGGYGEVIRGLYNGKTVAIKRLLPARRRDPSRIRSFFKEIQLTASLDHECIVQFIGVAWDIPANLCMVSEFMHGGDLRMLLTQYARDHHAHGHDDGKLRIAVQVAHAMTYLHSLDTPVVHRDLKSRNILLTESMDAKVIDFGISCERLDETMTAGVGTSLWMAPEIMLGKRYDEKADVFSFGVILSELDTHELPYDDTIDKASKRKMADMVLMQLICEGELKPRFTEMADPDMVALAKDCLEVDPEKRPRAAEVLYYIHRSHQHDRAMSVETRTAINRSLSSLGSNKGSVVGSMTGTLLGSMVETKADSP